MKEQKKKDKLWRGYCISMDQEGRDAVKFLQENGINVSGTIRKMLKDKAKEMGLKQEGEAK